MIQDIAGLLRENLQLIKEAFADAARTREEEAKFYSLQGGKGGGAAIRGATSSAAEEEKKKTILTEFAALQQKVANFKKSKFSSSSTAQLLSHSALGKGAGSLGSDGGGASEYSAVGSSKSIKSLRVWGVSGMLGEGPIKLCQ